MAEGDLMKAIVHMSVYGEDCQNAFWYRQTEDGNSAATDELYLANVLRNLYVGTVVPVLSEDASVDYVEVYNYTNGTGYAISTDITPDVGTVTQPSAPSQWCVGGKMARPGIGWNYPRKRISGFPLSVYIDNGLEPTFATLMQGFFNSLRTVDNSANIFRWVIIRTPEGFGLGNVDGTNVQTVGTCVEVYDASQQTRRN